MSTFKLLYFAAASTYTGRDHDDFPAPVKASELFALLEDRYPGITQKVLTTCAVTVNYNYVDLEDADAALVLGQGDEVALIPPVSSG
ncbi:molybdopterin synthase small subunit CnxG [Phyllosticta citrichinensis]|uniref:Molybdopterin synthase sulfur carrier subunit n=1 Tax=Phyllosticta citrichinensis TaxID=1130410 RepID=A0ABR1XSC2_9PEZI